MPARGYDFFSSSIQLNKKLTSEQGFSQAAVWPHCGWPLFRRKYIKRRSC